MPSPSAEYQRERRARLAIAAGREPGRKGPAPTAECGTVSGYNRHRRWQEDTCEDCRAAWAEYRRAEREKKKG